MSKQYVQHVSGQGEKWEVYGNYASVWQIKAEPHWIYLPKSEYHLCEPPERWVQVDWRITSGMMLSKLTCNPDSLYCGDDLVATLQCGGRYRIAKLIVEKKVRE